MSLVFISSSCAGKARADAEGSPLSAGGFPGLLQLPPPVVEG